MTSSSREMMPERIVQYIERHFAEPITPHDVAQAMHYSLCHLTHVTRKTLGASVGDLLLHRRLEAAQQLLAETGLSVAEVARRAGFTDGAYFSRRFSRAMGDSPSHWRKAHRNPRARARCYACGTLLPLVALAQDDTSQVRAAAS